MKKNPQDVKIIILHDLWSIANRIAGYSRQPTLLYLTPTVAQKLLLESETTLRSVVREVFYLLVGRCHYCHVLRDFKYPQNMRK